MGPDYRVVSFFSSPKKATQTTRGTDREQEIKELQLQTEPTKLEGVTLYRELENENKKPMKVLTSMTSES